MLKLGRRALIDNKRRLILEGMIIISFLKVQDIFLVHLIRLGICEEGRRGMK